MDALRAVRRDGRVSSSSHLPVIARLAVVTLIGLATAWLWIRLGLYGFGLPIGLAALMPLAMLGVLYVRTRRIGDLGLLLGVFAAAWTAFEAWRWLNAASDPAVSIPGWTPVPLIIAFGPPSHCRVSRSCPRVAVGMTRRTRPG